MAMRLTKLRELVYNLELRQKQCHAFLHELDVVHFNRDGPSVFSVCNLQGINKPQAYVAYCLVLAIHSMFALAIWVSVTSIYYQFCRMVLPLIRIGAICTSTTR